MNKDFLRKIFCRNEGYVYKFLGTVPEGENQTAYITGLFVQAANNNLLSTTVVYLSKFNTTIIYANNDGIVNVSDDFEFITDLIPDVVEEPSIEG